MNWKKCVRKRSWPNLRYCLGICLGKNHEKSQSGYPVSGPRFKPRTSRIQSRSANHLATNFCVYFVCSLFNDAFSSADYIASNKRMIVNNELENIWKEAVVA
jgi:hypothetical protein